MHVAHAGAHLPLHLALLGLVLGLLFALEHGLWAGQQGLGPHQFGDLQGIIHLCSCLTEAAAGARMQQGLRKAAWYNSQSQTHGERTS